MSKHLFNETVDDVEFNGTYELEDDDDGYSPIFSLCTIMIDKGPDLMLVIDPRVVHQIEERLLLDWKYNDHRV
jgi:hypothetical protein